MGTTLLDTYMRILEVQHKYVHLRYIHVLTRRIIIIIKYIQSCIFFFSFVLSADIFVCDFKGNRVFILPYTVHIGRIIYQ